ncbi:MAG: DUF962 domain-containing protein [Rhodobiaceae bacterium]|nr:DUF962 domain-containing protein [Rhodobiaceae bacterium]
MSVETSENGRIATYTEFWPYYLQEHSVSTCRTMHYIGTALSIAALGMGVFVNAWWLLAAPLSGYFFAWVAHFTIEKNKPATFTYPLWSLVSDYRMFFAWIAGRLGPHLEEAGVR